MGFFDQLAARAKEMERGLTRFEGVLARANLRVGEIDRLLSGLRERMRQERYAIAIMGHVKAGKSTLINRLLDRTDDAIAPVDAVPCSSVVVVYRNGLQDRATVQFADGTEREVAFREVRDYATEEGNPRNDKGVQRITVEGRFPLLGDVVELVDTPGEGSIHASHDEVVYAVLPQVNAAIFLCHANAPFKEETRKLLVEFQQKGYLDKLFFVLSQIDRLDDEYGERDEAMAFVQKQVREALADGRHGEVTVAPVSAKTGEGLDGLSRQITRFIEKEAFSSQMANFDDMLAQARDAALRQIDTRLALHERSDEELDADLRNARAKLRETEGEARQERSRLEERRDAHFGKYCREVEAITKRRCGELCDQVDARSGLEAVFGREDLQESISAVIEEVRTGPLDVLLTALRKELAASSLGRPEDWVQVEERAAGRSIVQDNQVTGGTLGMGAGLASVGAGGYSLVLTLGAGAATLTSAALLPALAVAGGVVVFYKMLESESGRSKSAKKAAMRRQFERMRASLIDPVRIRIDEELDRCADNVIESILAEREFLESEVESIKRMRGERRMTLPHELEALREARTMLAAYRPAEG